jgi:hypothetical protein
VQYTKNAVTLIPMRHKWKLIVTGSAVLAIFLLSFPIPYLASPAWNVLVVDEAGRPIPGMTVRLVYKNYSIEGDGHEEDRISDEHGRVTFPIHYLSASTLSRCYYTALSSTAIAHASFGPHSYVFAFGNGLEGSAISGQYETDWTGQPDHMESRIIAVPLKK